MMTRRRFLGMGLAATGGVFVPQFGRWFSTAGVAPVLDASILNAQHGGGLWSAEPVLWDPYVFNLREDSGVTYAGILSLEARFVSIPPTPRTV